MLQSTDDTDNSALDFSPGLAAPGNFSGDRTRELTVSRARGDVVLSWAGPDPMTVHKTGSASTVRTSIAIATESEGYFTDPDPAQFTLSFYVIKP